MDYVIKGFGLTAKIESLGAQLVSLKDENEKEYIWQRVAPYWGDCAPILFPIVGRCKDGILSVDGKDYTLDICHGFAQTYEFGVKEQSDSEITLRLTSTAETLACYPFEFILDITYKIDESGLTTAMTVTNPSEKKMMFGIGGHPGFGCSPLEDCELDFQKELTLDSLIVNDAFYITPDTKRIMENSSILPLKRELFSQDALIFENPSFDSVILRDRKDGSGILFTFSGFTSFAIWSQTENADFVCLEPWNGMGKRSDEGTELSEKTGIITLSGGEQFKCNYCVKPIK